MTVSSTHVGSLPRSQKVVDFIFARERNEEYDDAAFDAAMSEAVMETVGMQKDAGIDIVSDGETSKISYATYVKDRYTGFDGDSPRNAPADLKMFPSFLERLANDGGTPKYARPMCVGEVTSKGQGELENDIANLKAAMAAHGVERGFMNAASPGVISLFLQNDYYPDAGCVSCRAGRCDEGGIRDHRGLWSRSCSLIARTSRFLGTCSSRSFRTMSS